MADAFPLFLLNAVFLLPLIAIFVVVRLLFWEDREVFLYLHLLGGTQVLLWGGIASTTDRAHQAQTMGRFIGCPRPN